MVPGTRLGRFEIEARLGEGGMGTVYRARDPSLDRSVAVKVLRPEVLVGHLHAAEARSRLLREARALARVADPHVVRVHEVGEAGEHVFLVMELVDGATLRTWLRAQPRGGDEILAALIQAGRGLVAAHAAGFVHRDVKPENVLIGADGRVRITDFGLVGITAEPVDEAITAARAQIDVALTHTGAIVGTPAYMAPEQFRGGDVAAPADQFGFCVTAWEALIGERPFGGARYVDLARDVCAGRMRALPDGCAVPDRVLAALRRGLEVEPAARWPSVAALLDALAPPAPPPRPRSRRGWLAAVAGVAVIAALAWWAWPREVSVRAAAPVHDAAPVAAPRPPAHARAIFADGRPALGDEVDVVDLAVSAAGRLVFADAGRGGVLVTRGPGLPTVHELTAATLGAVRAPAVDAADRHVAFGVEGAGLYVIRVIGTRAERLTDGPDDHHPVWLADGRVAFTRAGAVWIIDPATRGLQATTRQRETVASLGTELLLTSHDHRELFRWDPATDVEQAVALPATVGPLTAAGDARAVLVADATTAWHVPLDGGAPTEVWRVAAPYTHIEGVALTPDGAAIIVAAISAPG